MFTKKSVIPTLALFGSISTLLCCALPALLVSLGAGAALISLVSAVPQLIWLSEHKIGLFVFVGVMLMLSGVSRYMTRNAPCPTDAAAAEACQRLRRISFGIFCFSLAMYLVGFFFAFIARYVI
jgi:hypothetical protein